MKTRILIADDHAIIRYGLASLIATQPDMEVVGQAKNGREAVDIACRTNPDIVLMDIEMPKMDGVEATKALRDKVPSAKVVVLTSFIASDKIAHALDSGASGAITKTANEQDILPTLRKIAAGERVISPDIRRQLAVDPPVPKLSPRQREILDSIVRGMTNKAIASQLGIRKDGVEKHIEALFSKIGAVNRADAVAIAMRKHLLMT